MSGATLRARPPALVRRWCMPPALLSDPSAAERIPGLRILHEHDDATGMLLWLCYRDVTWAETPARERSVSFRPSPDSAPPALFERSGALTLFARTAGPDGAPHVVEAWHGAHALPASFGEGEDTARAFMELGRAAAEVRQGTRADDDGRRAPWVANRVEAHGVAQEYTAFLDHLRVRVRGTAPGRADG